jgi:hypothetical protein
MQKRWRRSRRGCSAPPNADAGSSSRSPRPRSTRAFPARAGWRSGPHTRRRRAGQCGGRAVPPQRELVVDAPTGVGRPTVDIGSRKSGPGRRRRHRPAGGRRPGGPPRKRARRRRIGPLGRLVPIGVGVGCERTDERIVSPLAFRISLILMCLLLRVAPVSRIAVDADGPERESA